MWRNLGPFEGSSSIDSQYGVGILAQRKEDNEIPAPVSFIPLACIFVATQIQTQAQSQHSSAVDTNYESSLKFVPYFSPLIRITNGVRTHY